MHIVRGRVVLMLRINVCIQLEDESESSGVSGNFVASWSTV